MPFTESLVRSEARRPPLAVAYKMSPRPRLSRCGHHQKVLRVEPPRASRSARERSAVNL
jgi:hypothetical protein